MKRQQQEDLQKFAMKPNAHKCVQAYSGDVAVCGPTLFTRLHCLVTDCNAMEKT